MPISQREIIDACTPATLTRLCRKDASPRCDSDRGHAAGVLPVAMDAKGKTLYGRMVERKCLLGPGPPETSTKKTRRIRLHRVSHTALAETAVPASQGSPARKVEQNFPCEYADTRK